MSEAKKQSKKKKRHFTDREVMIDQPDRWKIVFSGFGNKMNELEWKEVSEDLSAVSSEPQILEVQYDCKRDAKRSISAHSQCRSSWRRRGDPRAPPTDEWSSSSSSSSSSWSRATVRPLIKTRSHLSSALAMSSSNYSSATKVTASFLFSDCSNSLHTVHVQ